jgi:hypothetical protein
MLAKKAIGYTKRMPNRYDQSRAKLAADNKAKEGELEQDHTAVITFIQPRKSG